MIANIHLLTIGYILLAIFGALLQMLPVVAGAIIPKPKLVANITDVKKAFKIEFIDPKK